MATFQISVAARNAMLEALETELGANPILKMRTGALPSNVAASDSGTVVATLALPADAFAAAASGVKSKNGTWQDLLADNAGVIGHYRIYKSDGTTCVMQGDVTEAGGGGMMIVDNNDVNAGQQVSVTSFDITQGGA